jgi:hypothetical protein
VPHLASAGFGATHQWVLCGTVPFDPSGNCCSARETDPFRYLRLSFTEEPGNRYSAQATRQIPSTGMINKTDRGFIMSPRRPRDFMINAHIRWHARLARVNPQTTPEYLSAAAMNIRGVFSIADYHSLDCVAFSKGRNDTAMLERDYGQRCRDHGQHELGIGIHGSSMFSKSVSQLLRLAPDVASEHQNPRSSKDRAVRCFG